MPLPPPPDLRSADAAILVVLLPLVAAGVTKQVPATIKDRLAALQRRLDPAIQVLIVEEDSYPAVVHSFHVTHLPAFVLVQQGVELWRQLGLPEGEVLAQQLLARLSLASGLANRGANN